MSQKPTVVIGLGNLLLSDEGIGIHIINRLNEKKNRMSSEAELLDLGTGEISLLHAIAGRRKAIIVDCAFMDQEAGTIRKFTLDEIRSVKLLSHLSSHENDPVKIFELSRKLGECPAEVIFFGIQPEHITPENSLSPTLRNRLEEYVNLLIAEIGP